MLNIPKFKQFISPGLLLASVLLTSQLTLSAADGGLRATASRLIYRAFGWQQPVDQALLDAVEAGNGAAVATALVTGANVNARDNYGGTALMKAAGNGHTAIVTQLLAAGADVNARGNNGMTALFCAARRGRTAIETQLLAAGADVNARGKNGMTALMGAASGGCTTIGEQLLAAGADVNTRDNDSYTALIYAARDNTAIVTQLLAAGADVNARNNDSYTALMWAARRDRTAAITQLLTAGAEIPAGLQTHPQILAQPETLRTTPALIRALTSSYHKQVLKAFTRPDIITVLATSDLSAIQHKFIINPGVQILPDLDLLATGATRAVGELGPEITPEAFSILDLAILSGNLALVDQLLMSGLSPEHLTQQTRGLLESFPAPDSGAREAKGADDHAMTVAEADSEQIAQLIYYADMAHTTEIQNIVRGAASNFSTEPLPAPVTRYAKATKEFQAWARTQIVDLPVAVAMQVGSVAAANITDSAAVEPTAYDNSAAVVSTDSASNSYLQRALIAGGIALAVVAVAAIVRRSR